MARALGNSSVSALISSAKSGMAAVQSLQDAQQAFVFANGAQDTAAHDTYQKFLQGRVDQYSKSSNPADQLKALNYVKAGQSAQHTFVKNQIQNSVLDLQRGNATPASKEALLRTLTQQAYATGDQQFGQTLEQQYNSQVVTNQNAATAAGNRSQASTAKQYTDKIAQVKDQIKAVEANTAKTGSLVALDSSGKPFMDKATGKPFSVSGMKAFLYGQIHDLAGQAQAAGFDDNHTSAIINAANTAFDNKDYQQSVTNLNLEGKGQVPQVVKQNGVDEFGRPIYGLEQTPQVGIAAKQNGGKFDFTPTFSQDPGATAQNVSKDTYDKTIASMKKDGLIPSNYNGSSDGSVTFLDPQLHQMVRGIIDPTSGGVRYTSVDANGNITERQVAIDSNVNGRGANTNPISEVSFQQLQAEQAAREPKDSSSLAANPDLQPVGSDLAKIVGYTPTGNANMDRNVVESRIQGLEAQASFNQAAAQKAQAARELQLQQSISANQATISSGPGLYATRGNSAASYGGGAPKAPVVPTAPSSSAYLPSPAPGQTPAQTFQAEVGSNPAPNNAQIAKGIGAAVGINPNIGL